MCNKRELSLATQRSTIPRQNTKKPISSLASGRTTSPNSPTNGSNSLTISPPRQALRLQMLADLGVELKSGQIIDATFVPVPIRRNSRGNSALIKAGAVSLEWGKTIARHACTDASVHDSQVLEGWCYGAKRFGPTAPTAQTSGSGEHGGLPQRMCEDGCAARTAGHGRVRRKAHSRVLAHTLWGRQGTNCGVAAFAIPFSSF